MMKKSSILSFAAAVTGLISALIGVFYTFGGAEKTVTNIYGKEYILYGDGIYASNTLTKTGSQKGADIVIIALCIFIFITIFQYRKPFAEIVRVDLLTCLMYFSICLVTGISCNILFPLYIVQFSCTLFALILSMTELMKRDCFDADIYSKRMKGAAVFLLIGGCYPLIWLVFIISVLVTGDFSSVTAIYTTEPAVAIDLGIILPCCITIGIGLLQRRRWAYLLASIFMMLFSCMGFSVILSTVFQLSYGISFSIGELIGPVGSSIILAVPATILNTKLIRHSVFLMKECNE